MTKLTLVFANPLPAARAGRSPPTHRCSRAASRPRKPRLF